MSAERQPHRAVSMPECVERYGKLVPGQQVVYSRSGGGQVTGALGAPQARADQPPPDVKQREAGHVVQLRHYAFREPDLVRVRRNQPGQVLGTSPGGESTA